ncbi:MAG: hypothetical protein ACJA2C_002542 [Marinoscillum sp.]|jgi:hypothetical protein
MFHCTITLSFWSSSRTSPGALQGHLAPSDEVSENTLEAFENVIDV